MNRTEKLKTLQDALQGKSGQLKQIQLERQKEAMPYINATGYVDFHNCPPAFLDFNIHCDYYSPYTKHHKIFCTVREGIEIYNQVETKERFLFSTGCSIIWIDDERYDNEPLAFLCVRGRDYKDRYLQGKTVSDLRSLYKQSTDSFYDSPHVAIFFETKQDRLNWYAEKSSISEQQ